MLARIYTRNGYTVIFPRTSRNRRGKNVYEYAQIAEHYRENGKQKMRVLEHLGPVRSDEDMKRYMKMQDQHALSQKIYCGTQV